MLGGAGQIYGPVQNGSETPLVQTKPTILQEDNQSLIRMSLAQNEAERTKHWDYKIHYIRDVITKFGVSLAYVGTKGQMADGFTKAVPRDQLRREQDHNNGSCRQAYAIQDRIFRENSAKLEPS